MLTLRVAESNVELAKSHDELETNERHFRFLTEVIPQQFLGVAAANSDESGFTGESNF